MTESLAAPTRKVHLNFHAPVEYAAGGDVKIINEMGGRPLTKRERNALNALVERLIKEFGQERWEPWKFLHETIGVNEIGEMRLEHLKPAQVLLQLMLEAKEAASGTSLEEVWRQEYQSVCCDLVEQSEVEVQLRAELRHWQHAHSELKRERDRLQQGLTQLNATIAQWDREKQSRSGEVIRLQQRLSLEMQEHQHAQAEINRSAHRITELELQVDSLIAGKSSTAQTLEEVQGKTEQAKRVIRRLWSGLICGGLLAVLASGALVYRPIFQAELRAEQNNTVMLQRKDICLFDGKPFSWGTRLPTSTGMQKCIRSRTGQYLWQPER